MLKREIGGIVSLFAISVFGGVLIPQVILPAYFSGVTETHPSWGLLSLFMYVGIGASVLGSVIMMLLFKKRRSLRKMALKLLYALILTLIWLILASYVALFIVKPEIWSWSAIDTLTIYFQYPTYAGIYVWTPSGTWFISVIIYNIAYLIMVMRIEPAAIVSV